MKKRNFQKAFKSVATLSALGLLATLALTTQQARLARGDAVTLAREASALPVPPAPTSASAPAVDLTLLAAMRSASVAPALSASPANAFVAPWQASLTRPSLDAVSTGDNACLGGILKDVSQDAGGRQRLASMLFDRLRERLPNDSSIILEQATLPDDLSLPGDGWTVNFDFRLPETGVGRAFYMANARDGKTGKEQRFNGSVTIDREAEGLMVTRLTRMGDVLGAGDVQKVATRLSQLPRGAMTTLASVLGSKARQELRPGQWLTDPMLSTPDVVKRGQLVTMRLVHGPLTITGKGIVMQPGGLGQTVKIQNVDSKKEIFAMVVSKDQVQVMQ
jgi:flagella basal body P-ring formation protein FlgA